MHLTVAIFILTNGDLLNDEVVEDLYPGPVDLLVVVAELFPHKGTHGVTQIGEVGRWDFVSHGAMATSQFLQQWHDFLQVVEVINHLADVFDNTCDVEEQAGTVLHLGG